MLILYQILGNLLEASVGKRSDWVFHSVNGLCLQCLVNIAHIHTHRGCSQGIKTADGKIVG